MANGLIDAPEGVGYKPYTAPWGKTYKPQQYMEYVNDFLAINGKGSDIQNPWYGQYKVNPWDYVAPEKNSLFGPDTARKQQILGMGPQFGKVATLRDDPNQVMTMVNGGIGGMKVPGTQRSLSSRPVLWGKDTGSLVGSLITGAVIGGLTGGIGSALGLPSFGGGLMDMARGAASGSISGK